MEINEAAIPKKALTSLDILFGKGSYQFDSCTAES